MTDRCEPPEHLRGVNGWHHVNVAGIKRPLWWSASAMIPPDACYSTAIPAWIAPGGGRIGPHIAYLRNYRYLSPVATPAEVEALRAERDKLRTANTAYRFMLSNAKDKCTTLRARVETLEAVIKRLGSSKAFVLAGPIDPEMLARIEYARAAMLASSEDTP